MLRTKNLFPAIIVSIAACSDFDSGSATENAVVESYLRPGNGIEVTIFKEGLFEAGTIDTVEYINGLVVSITEGENEYTLQELSDGRYVSEEGVTVSAEAIYSLEFNYQDKNLTASTYVPTKPEGFTLSANEIEIERPDFSSGPPELPDPIDVSWENPENDYHLVVITSIEDDPEPINEDEGIVRLGSFRNEPNTGTAFMITPMSFEYYGMHAVVLYKLNAEYAALYEDNGSSSINLKSPYSNIVNGLGIFTGVNTDTLFVNVKKP